MKDKMENKEVSCLVKEKSTIKTWTRLIGKMQRKYKANKGMSSR